MTLVPEKIQEIKRLVKEQPMALTIMIARKAGVTERDVFEALEGETAWALDPHRFEEVMNVLTAWGKVMVIVKNPYAVMESFGQLGGYTKEGGYFNVKTEDIDMHIKPEGIVSMYLVNKPAHTDGMPTHSVQFFDQEGHAVFKVFLTTTAGNRRPSVEAQAAYEKLKNEFVLSLLTKRII